MTDEKRDAPGLFPPGASSVIAVLSVVGIAAHLALRLFPSSSVRPDWLPQAPLLVVLLLGGLPLVVELAVKAYRGEFGSDLLAGVSILTAAVLEQYLAGALVVLMLSGGQTLESFAVRRASSVLDALAKRIPTVAHRLRGDAMGDVRLEDVNVGDRLVIFPHEICPVDGTVVEGTGTMDESYLTGEPYMIAKTVGSQVLSGAINGIAAISIRADRQAVDSRYATIMKVMKASEQKRPRLRRLGDQLGAWYTPIALTIAALAWMISGESVRFLAVLVVATPCPLLIAIPVAIIGAISLSARRGIIIKDPAVMERVEGCRTAIFDKTGTLTYGRPQLAAILPAGGFSAERLLRVVAGVEQYSRHPLATAVLEAAAARGLKPFAASELSEAPGQGLTARVDGQSLHITSRRKLLGLAPEAVTEMPPQAIGLECLVLADGRYAGTLQFRDQPRGDSGPFLKHVGPLHKINRILLISGDREVEVRRLAEELGIHEVYAGQSPEQKLALVRDETERAQTLYVGDGINDAPALTAATVGLAFGGGSDITAEAAGAVILEGSLRKVDEFLHISHRVRSIALESAVGGMLLSAVGMAFAAAGYLTPVAGAVLQELIDVLAIANALRVSIPPRSLSDY